MIDESIKKKRGRKASTSNQYWTQETEDAVRFYVKSDASFDEKNRVYTNSIHKPLTKLVRAVTKRYCSYWGKEGYQINYEDIVEDMFIHVFNNIHLVDQDRINKNGEKVRAYSYLGTINRNEVGKLAKNMYNKDTNSVDFDIISNNLENNQDFHYYLENEEDKIKKDGLYDDIIKNLLYSIKNEIKYNENLKQNDLKVANSIIAIFENWDHIYEPSNENMSSFIMKRKIQQMIKEMSGLEAKEIKSSTGKFKNLYLEIKKLCENDETEISFTKLVNEDYQPITYEVKQVENDLNNPYF
jgi:uncharacterized protein YozE (UPF0346 family)